MHGRQRQPIHSLKLPRKLLDGRRTICKIIADLPPKCSQEHIRSILEPVVEGIISDRTLDSSGDARVSDYGEGVTPIMVACDKSELACLEFIEQTINKLGSSEDIRMMIDLMGHPFDRCLDECGGNSAAHLAASTGFTDGVDFLVAVLENIASKHEERLAEILKNIHSNLDSGKDLDKCSQAMRDENAVSVERRDLYLAILSTGNAHSDTPLMIASASGHASFLNHVLMKMLPDGWEGTTLVSQPSGNENRLARVRRAFELKNSSGDTALSLACGHGYSDVIEVLIGSVVGVKYDDLEHAKAIVAKTDEALKLMIQKHGRNQMESYKRRGKNVKRCLVMLQIKQAKTAQETMDNLLMEEQQKETHAKAKTSSRRKKKKSGRSAMKLTPSISDHKHNPLDNGTTSQIGSDDDSAYSVKDQTLHEIIHTDRSQCNDVSPLSISSSRCDIHNAIKGDTLAFASKIPEEENPTDEVTVAGNGDGEKDEGGTTLEAEMESLCLDTSMLLLTPHGMAMKLSPSQLDVVENVLEQQLAAVQQARRIQSRLLSQK
uniref:Uncharacterized protein n=1 Tax=Odontella aurita TaxID=265563 RepID=A0A7S4JBL1_9STRA|mmetsp:Transcript_43222/g.131596  ORF Transcript_43222/g.131596 Transcript_43222/m.131596 type:complete len:547 (+) Transcript_43222:408-2048(+)